MNAWMSSASATATATVITSSISPFMPDPPAYPPARRLAPRSPPLEESDPVRRPVGQERLPDDPGAGDGPPEPAVLGVRAVVAHHVVVASGNGDRLGEVARRVAVALHDVGVGLRLAVADHVSVDDREMVARESDHALDERLRGRLRPGHLAS